jgi:hypothetical protein
MAVKAKAGLEFICKITKKITKKKKLQKIDKGEQT